ncbi:MAG: hypothetical protein L6367_04705, partial [Cellulomonas sp.]|nr:hypothetical protein [Cellulomonas sp.]
MSATVTVAVVVELSWLVVTVIVEPETAVTRPDVMPPNPPPLGMPEASPLGIVPPDGIPLAPPDGIPLAPPDGIPVGMVPLLVPLADPAPKPVSQVPSVAALIATVVAADDSESVASVLPAVIATMQDPTVTSDS